MDEMNILNLRNHLNKYGVIMSFTGPFSQGLIEEIGEALRNYLQSKTNSRGEIFKVFSVFIEQTQNIKNYAYQISHQEVQEKILLSGILNIGTKEGKYFISSGNLVKNEDIADLKDRLTTIKSYSRTELAKAYRKKLRESRDPGEGDGKEEGTGAGLGLLEMARKASEELYFNFEKVDEEYKYFTLTIRI